MKVQRGELKAELLELREAVAVAGEQLELQRIELAQTRTDGFDEETGGGCGCGPNGLCAYHAGLI